MRNKCVKARSSQFPMEDVETVNKDMKNCSASFTIKERQTKNMKQISFQGGTQIKNTLSPMCW